MLALQARRLVPKLIDLVAKRICLGYLRQIQEPKDTTKDDKDDGITDRPQATPLAHERGGVLVAPGIALAAHGQRT